MTKSQPKPATMVVTSSEMIQPPMLMEMPALVAMPTVIRHQPRNGKSENATLQVSMKPIRTIAG